jgi:hypothetical protein
MIRAESKYCVTALRMVPLQSTSRTAKRHAPLNLASDWTGPDYRKFTSGGQAAVGSGVADMNGYGCLNPFD